MDDLKKFSTALAGATQTQGTGSYIPEVASYGRAAFLDNRNKNTQEGFGAVADQTASAEKDAEETSRKARMQQLQDMIDPSKYRKEQADDGGFKFFDPTGKAIGADTFARRTGQRIVDVLKDSENPIDQQYVSDYMNANDLAQAMYNNDTGAIDQFLANNPDLKRSGKPEDYFKQLMDKYPHLYGRGSYAVTVANRNKRLFGEPSLGASSSSGGGSWSPS